jgi:hypothetical protein
MVALASTDDKALEYTTLEMLKKYKVDE